MINMDKNILGASCEAQEGENKKMGICDRDELKGGQAIKKGGLYVEKEMR